MIGVKISSKGRYGLRAMVDLALNTNGGHVALCSIAERQGISLNYLEQVFSALKKAGLVRSIKGAQGGYILGESPANLKVGTILRALEGQLSVIDEGTENLGAGHISIDHSIKVNVWDKMNERINSLVDSITLEDLVEYHKKMIGTASSMYYI